MKLKTLSIPFFITIILSYLSIIGYAHAQEVETDTNIYPPLSDASLVLNLWPNKIPGNSKKLSKEYDKTKPDDELVAGHSIIRLTNVSNPQIAVYKPEPLIDTKTAVIVAPGGGHWILAYDLEGTEVVQWLNSIGVTAVLLKYRVPGNTWNKEKRWLAAAQDGQRAVSLLRGKAKELGIYPDRIGMIGFSAGGTPVVHSAFNKERLYEPVDQYDDIPFRINFAAPIYTGGLPKNAVLNENSPPTFIVATSDDPYINPISIIQTYSTLKKAGVSTELHIYESGGHGFGIRNIDKPVSSWPQRMEEWMKKLKLLER